LKFFLWREDKIEEKDEKRLIDAMPVFSQIETKANYGRAKRGLRV